MDKALKYLLDLRKHVKYDDDIYAVYLFAALCLTDIGLYKQAEQIYKQLINAEISNSRIYSNLGHVQTKMGAHNDALRNYKYALDFDPQNAIAYNNIAQSHFHMHNFDDAIINAEKALEINSHTYQASTLLAVIYRLLGDNEKYKKYFHIAISTGAKPDDIHETIEYYQKSDQISESETEIEP